MTDSKKTNKKGVKWFWNKIRYGLFFHGLISRLGVIGIHIRPYYWVQEGIDLPEKPLIKGDTSNFEFGYFGVQEIKEIASYQLEYKEDEMLNSLERGDKCIGIKENERLVAFMFIELKECDFVYRKFKLKENEAYLDKMHTFDEYRGRNIAAHLRYQSYEILNEIGRNVIYSVSEYFNKGAIKYKKKLNARHLRFYLYLGLFGKIHKNMLLRTYKN